MSLSNPTNFNTNPSAKFFTWSGGQGKIKYYDKLANENKVLDLPISFIKLDNLSTVTGWSNNDESKFWSNEVRSLKMEPLVVKTKNGIKKEGVWSDIQEAIKAQGAKFASSVYVAYLNEDKELELCNFRFSGASAKSWFDFTKENKIKDGDAISISEATKSKNGGITYFSPIFSKIDVTPEQLDKAKELDKQLQTYLDGYFSYGKAKEESKSSDDELPENVALDLSDDDMDDLIPF